MPDLFDRDKSERKYDESDVDPHTRADAEKHRIDGERQGILKEQITALRGAVKDNFDPSRVPATQLDFQAMQSVAAGIDLPENYKIEAIETIAKRKSYLIV
jgi:hypothetical protein